MRIAVLSDTHASSLDDLPPRLLAALAGVDMVLHLGDYANMEVVDGLRRLHHFEGIHGNMDSAGVKQSLPEQRVVEVEGKRIGTRFPAVDAVLYGHTHRSSNGMDGDVLVFNPGSVPMYRDDPLSTPATASLRWTKR
jgi:hypothetical protein